MVPSAFYKEKKALIGRSFKPKGRCAPALQVSLPARHSGSGIDPCLLVLSCSVNFKASISLGGQV